MSRLLAAIHGKPGGIRWRDREQKLNMKPARGPDAVLKETCKSLLVRSLEVPTHMCNSLLARSLQLLLSKNIQNQHIEIPKTALALWGSQALSIALSGYAIPYDVKSDNSDEH